MCGLCDVGQDESSMTSLSAGGRVKHLGAVLKCDIADLSVTVTHNDSSVTCSQARLITLSHRQLGMYAPC